MSAYTLGLITENATETVDQGLITNAATTQQDYGSVEDPILYSVQLTGIEVTSTTGTISVLVDDTKTVTGIELNSEFGSVVASGIQNQTAIVSGVESVSELGSITVQVTDLEAIDGVEAQTQLGNITVSATRNPIVSVTGVQLQSQVGNITVNAEGRQITGARKSRKKAYFLPFKPIPIITEVKKDGVARIEGKLLSADRSIIRASGTISISTIAKISPVKSATEINKLNAAGIINPTDDELIWLLAA